MKFSYFLKNFQHAYVYIKTFFMFLLTDFELVRIAGLSACGYGMMNIDLRRQVMEGGKGQKRFPCNYCDRMFTSSQALGGHQNGHRLERETARKAQEEAHIFALQMPPHLPPACFPSFRPKNHQTSSQHDHQNHAQPPSYLANRSIPRPPYSQPHRSLTRAYDGMRPKRLPRFAFPYPPTTLYPRGMPRDEDPRFSARNSTTATAANVGGVTRGGDPRFRYPCAAHVGAMSRNEAQQVLMNATRNYIINNGVSHVLAERAQANMTGPLTAMTMNHGEVADAKNAAEKEIDLTLRL